jgi:hypothetical protein
MARALPDFFRRPWSFAARPKLAAGEEVMTEVAGPTTLVTFTNRQVIVSRPFVYPQRFLYSEIKRLTGKPGLSEEDPVWGFTIEDKLGEHQFPMLGASRVETAFVEALVQRRNREESGPSEGRAIRRP